MSKVFRTLNPTAMSGLRRVSHCRTRMTRLMPAKRRTRFRRRRRRPSSVARDPKLPDGKNRPEVMWILNMAIVKYAPYFRCFRGLQPSIFLNLGFLTFRDALCGRKNQGSPTEFRCFLRLPESPRFMDFGFEIFSKV